MKSWGNKTTCDPDVLGSASGRRNICHEKPCVVNCLIRKQRVTTTTFFQNKIHSAKFSYDPSKNITKTIHFWDNLAYIRMHAQCVVCKAVPSNNNCEWKWFPWSSREIFCKLHWFSFRNFLSPVPWVHVL